MRNYLYRFTILQSLSVLIALFGLLTDSAAVVIGAMLVAPLMRPVLGVAATLVIGRPVRTGVPFVVVIAASAGSIFLAWFVTMLLPSSGGSLTEQILQRTSPTLLDLGIALAAGAAGAYALVRREISDALPGVAVAVALVPPLATVGVTFALGRPDLSLGALLLYLTNLAAIVLIGAVVFVLTGFAPRAQDIRAEQQVAYGIVVAAIAVLAVSVPLGLHTAGELREGRDTEIANQAAREWARGTGLQVTGVNIASKPGVLGLRADQEQVTVDVAGPENPPPVEPLAQKLAEDFASPAEVSVRWVERSETSARSEP